MVYIGWCGLLAVVAWYGWTRKGRNGKGLSQKEESNEDAMKRLLSKRMR